MGFLLLPHNELYYVIIIELNESKCMLNPVIQGIFPIPLIFTNIEREFSKEELEFFDEQSKKTYKNVSNTTSLDSYLMESDAMTTIKQEITSALQMYVDNIIKPKDDVKSYITQSWLNFTSENQYHHKHAHPNSFLSGVLYVNADPEKDKITFCNDGVYKQIKLETKEFNIFNSENCSFTVRPGDIVVFASSLIHVVEQKAGNNIRTSLSFNSFLRGKIGTKTSLTELILT